MKTRMRTKVGGSRGNPGYRTPAGFRARRSLKAKIYNPTNPRFITNYK
jgi:hypothetical protein